ncbi:MAG: hypothetical protein DYH07_07245 [Armatimonadetes bacterium ATM1]|nr:MAG: hypothetical protein EDM73_06890 [Armatimonadota bacterium]MBC6968745.1 hypothetical protein [Armatimonadota bacterium]MCE7899874.1 hypothetical protein [Armatimonadetes bacterium ATM1]RIJ96952.1 MAG: hypothetical protein DCC45_06235 [Armatimonadota bacterium]
MSRYRIQGSGLAIEPARRLRSRTRDFMASHESLSQGTKMGLGMPPSSWVDQGRIALEQQTKSERTQITLRRDRHKGSNHRTEFG